MPYSDKQFKKTNIKYTNKDFTSLKNTLIEYAKSYFPDTYKDFNETSPGMMLIEMGAYVGDVLSFYLDQQYKEMMLPLAEERKNVINLAKMLGYKVKPTSPAYVDLTVKQIIAADTSDINKIVPDLSNAAVINKGMRVTSIVDTSNVFETLDFVDFKITSSSDIKPVEYDYNDDGVVSQFELSRKVKAISAETKTTTFTISSPTKFLKLALPQDNVVEIISCVDSNSNKWYEVDYLAQDRVPQEKHYTEDSNRTTAYEYFTTEDGSKTSVPVPYSLQYLQTGKRFITEIDENNITSLVFGNGVLRNGVFSEDDFIALGSTGIVTGGDTNLDTLGISIDPQNGDSRITLGETPANTTLTITYRVGGGISSNAPANDLTTISSKEVIEGNGSSLFTVTNELPAVGGSDGESIDEIREKAKAFFASQNRCVNQKDYEARVLSMPNRFGQIAKVFVGRRNTQELFSNLSSAVDDNGTINQEEFDLLFSDTEHGNQIPTVDCYVLAYNDQKHLTTLPASADAETAEVHPLKVNLKNYLAEYRMMTDQVSILDGYIINFGVAFEIVAHRSANKSDVKLKCIQKIKEYFNIDKMQFRQTIYTSDLEYELMDVDGVRSVNYVELTQNFNDLVHADSFIEGSNNVLLYDKEYDITDGGATIDYTSDDENHKGIYGWKYNFNTFYIKGSGAFVRNGLILPPKEPAVFELKNPNRNIRGVIL